MKNILLKSVFFTLAIAGIHTQAVAQSATKANLGAHVHGLSELTVVTEGHSLEIQLISPAMDLVGFEHRASTPAHVKAVEQAALALRQHSRVFLLSGGNCKHVNTSIDVSKLIDADNHKHNQQSEGNHHKDHAHKEHNHKDHAHKEHNHKDHAHKEHNHNCLLYTSPSPRDRG